MPDSSALVGLLAKVGRGLRRRMVLNLGALVLATTALTVLAAAAIDKFYPMTEEAAFSTLAMIGFLGGLAAVLTIWRGAFAPARPLNVARALEQRRPEMAGALVCAVEKSALPVEKRSGFDLATIETAAERALAANIDDLLVPRRARGWRHAALLAAALVLAAGAVGSRLVVKAFHHGRGVVGLGAPAIILAPGDIEVELGGEVTVAAKAERWERRYRIEYEIGGTGKSFPMNAIGEGAVFTFYAVDKPIRYRVATPALASAWFTITPFTPPKAEKILIFIRPPAYTGAAEVVRDGFGALRELQGSAIEVAMRVGHGVADAKLEVDGRDIPPRFRDEVFSFQHQLAAGLDLDVIGRELSVEKATLTIFDERGRGVSFGPVVWEGVPDAPPVIDVQSPGRDLAAKTESKIPFAARVADDFGVVAVALRYAVSGGERRSKVLYAFLPEDGKFPPPSADIIEGLSPADFAAEPGDIVSYYFEALDNRFPRPSMSRSQLYFIEVAADEDEPEDEEGMEGEERQLDVQALIAELKRLLRVAHDYRSAAAPQRQAILDEDLRPSMADLLAALAKQADEVVANTMPGSPLAAHFTTAEKALAGANESIRGGGVKTAVPPMELALARLAAAAREMERQSRSESKDGEGGGEGGAEEQTPRETAGWSAAEAIERLAAVINQINTLADRQGQLNSGLRKWLDNPGGAPRPSAERQSGVARDIESLARELRGFPALEELPMLVSGAAAAAGLAAANLTVENLPEALAEGISARESLLAASEALDGAASQIAAAAIESLSHAAAQIAARQRNAAEDARAVRGSGESSAAGAGRLGGEQADIAGAAERNFETARRLAASLEGRFPEAGAKLGSAAAAAADYERESARAANALLYRRFERAAELQEAAAAVLDAMAAGAGEAAMTLPRISRAEIVTALRQLLEQLAAIDRDGSPQSVKDAAARLGPLLDSLAEKLGDPSLERIAADLRSLAAVERPDPRRAGDIIEAAARTLRQRLMEMEAERRLEISRRLGSAPPAYRQLVEEYFKSLGESPPEPPR